MKLVVDLSIKVKDLFAYILLLLVDKLVSLNICGKFRECPNSCVKVVLKFFSAPLNNITILPVVAAAVVG